MDNDSVECPRCGGTGKCIECGGEGSVICLPCSGTGSVNGRKCQSCDGTGRMPCPKECEVCGGSGRLTFEDKGKRKARSGPAHGDSYIAVSLARPVCTYALIAMCTIATLASGIIFGEGNILFSLGVFFAPFVKQGQWWRLITAMFLHGNAIHLILNMWCLYVLAPTIEQILMPRRFMALYFTAGVAGFLLSMIFMPEAPTVGASGALFGIMTSYFALQMKYRIFSPPAIKNLLFWFAINLALGLMMPSINMWAHVGGAAAGFLYTYALPVAGKKR